MPSFDVLTIGSATQDVFLQSKQFEEKRDPLAPDGLDACLPLGAKIGVDDLVLATGGGATNAAVTFANFGFKTCCISRIGQDNPGKSVLEDLKRYHVDAHFLQSDPKLKTAFSVILLSGQGHRAILTHRGAIANIQAKEIPWTKLKTRCLYITSVNGNLHLLKQIFAWTKKHNKMTAWNPGTLELNLGLKILRPFLQQTNVLILNREEASLLSSQPPRHLSSIISMLSAFPKTALVVTDGQKGAYVHHDGITLFAPPLKAKRINTTGAGDAFGSAFVASLIRCLDLKAALQVAMLNATGVITHMGAKAGILKKFPSKKESSSIKATIWSAA